MSFVLLADVQPATPREEVERACRYTAQCLYFCHCTKAPLDVCKFMYAAHRLIDPEQTLVEQHAPRTSSGTRGYKNIHSVMSHPISAWLCESEHNWLFMQCYGEAMFAEFDRRRGCIRDGRPHASLEHFQWLCLNRPRFRYNTPHSRLQRTPIPTCVEPWIVELKLDMVSSYWLHYMQKEYEVSHTAFDLEPTPTPRPLQLENPLLNKLFRAHCPDHVKYAFKHVQEQHGQCHQACVDILYQYERHAARGTRHVPPYLKRLRPYALKKIRRFDRQYLSAQPRNTRVFLYIFHCAKFKTTVRRSAHRDLE